MLLMMAAPWKCMSPQMLALSPGAFNQQNQLGCKASCQVITGQLHEVASTVSQADGAVMAMSM